MAPALKFSEKDLPPAKPVPTGDFLICQASFCSERSERRTPNLFIYVLRTLLVTFPKSVAFPTQS